MNPQELLLQLDSHFGFARFVLARDLDIYIGADGLARLNSPFGKKSEMILSPTGCRNALFEERDLWQ